VASPGAIHAELVVRAMCGERYEADDEAAEIPA